MDEELLQLTEKWNSNVTLFKIISKEYLTAVDTLAQLNVLIYKKCEEKGVSIDSLNLTK